MKRVVFTTYYHECISTILASTINATHHDFNLYQFKQLLVKSILVALYFGAATYPVVHMQERHDNVKNIAPQSQLVSIGI